MAKPAGPYQDRSQHRGRAAAIVRWLNGSGRWRKRFSSPPLFAAPSPPNLSSPHLSSPHLIRQKGVGLKERDIFGSKAMTCVQPLHRKSLALPRPKEFCNNPRLPKHPGVESLCQADDLSCALPPTAAHCRFRFEMPQIFIFAYRVFRRRKCKSLAAWAANAFENRNQDGKLSLSRPVARVFMFSQPEADRICRRMVFYFAYVLT